MKESIMIHALYVLYHFNSYYPILNSNIVFLNQEINSLLLFTCDNNLNCVTNKMVKAAVMNT